MKRSQATKDRDEMREEYDFGSMSGGVRGKYGKGLEGKVTTILLDSDVAEIFPDSEAVNEALRTLARVLRKEETIAQR